mmetsp:Transcript_71531/g.221200  ORF Transcript_71531/g.221200 Transcript_71531/m.221200 type:complete len:491 (-) Transcript_71531:37-1509(-)
MDPPPAPELRSLAPARGAEAGGGGGYGAAVQGAGPSKRRPSLPPLTTRNSAVLTAGIIIADVVGAGILSMGVAVSKLGWLLGSIVLALLLSLNVHVSLLMWRVRMGSPAAYTYLDLASAAFARAPVWQRRLVEDVTLGAQQLFIFLALAVYSLSIGRALGTLFYGELRLCLPLLVALGLLGFLPVQVSARSLGQYRSLILVNVLTIAGSVVIPLVHMAAAGVGETRAQGSAMRALADFSVGGMLSGVEVMNGAFSSQLMLVEIMAEMRDPSEFPRAYMISAPFQGIMFLVAGVGAYYFMGSQVSGILGENLPFGPTFRVAAACLLVHMLITFLIKGVVFCRWAQQTWDPRGLNDGSARGWLTWTLTVAVCTSLSWFAAQLVPFFTDFVDLLGASLVPLTCYVLPILMYLRWMHDRGELGSVGPAERCAIVLELLLSLLCMTFGTYHSLSAVARNWRAYGLPFECHCQNIWPTCECSAHHPGMESCLVSPL